MTLREIEDAALEMTGYDPAKTSPDVRGRLRRWVDRWHHDLCTRPGFLRRLRDHSTSFASVADQATYGLPAIVGRINQIYESTNDVVLQERTQDWLRHHDPGLETSASPSEVYVPLGLSPVHTLPADASAIFAVSSSASDTSSVKVLYRGINSSGQETSKTTALTGTTALQVSLDATQVTPTTITLDRPAVGSVTLTEDSAVGTTLGVIPAGATSVKYWRVQLWPTPSAVLTYTVDYTRDLRPLTADSDEPLLPSDFHYLLALGGEAEMWRYKDDPRYMAAVQRLESGIVSLNAWLWDSPNRGQDSVIRPSGSRLGGWFPRGS